MRLELVRDWMTRDVLTVEPGTPAVDAGNVMDEHTIRRLPVLTDGRLVGIVTSTDIRAARSGDPGVLTVAHIMSADPLTVNEDDTIGRAAQLMLVNRIGGLPVLNAGGMLVGIITESDIFRLVVHDWMHKAGEESEPYARYG